MYEDSPPELIHDHLAEALFGDHPLGRPIIGHAETLRAPRPRHRARLPRRPLREPGHRRRGRPGTSTTTSSATLAARHFRPDPGPSAPQRRAQHARDPPRRPLHARRTQSSTTSASAAPGPRRGDPRPLRGLRGRHASSASSWSSRLFQEVREKRGLAYSVYSYTSLYADTGLAGIYFGSREEAMRGGHGRHPRRAARLRGGHRRRGHRSAPRTTSRASSCSAWRAPAARMQSLGRAVLMDQPVLTRRRDAARRSTRSRTTTSWPRCARYYDPAKWSTVCIGPRARAVPGRHRGSRGRRERHDPTLLRHRRRRQDGSPERRDHRRPGRLASSSPLVDPRGGARPAEGAAASPPSSRRSPLTSPRRGARVQRAGAPCSTTRGACSRPACRTVVGATGLDDAQVDELRRLAAAAPAPASSSCPTSRSAPCS